MSREREVREITAQVDALIGRMAALERSFANGVTFALADSSLKSTRAFLGAVLERAVVLDAQVPLAHNHDAAGVYGGCPACFTDWAVTPEDMLRASEIIKAQVSPERAVQLSGDPEIWAAGPSSDT